MKKNIFITIMILPLIILGSCLDSMDKISIDPNRPEAVHPRVILTNLSITTFGIEFAGIEVYRTAWQWDNRGGGGHFNFMRRNFNNEYKRIAFVYDMINEANRINDERYVHLGAFFRAYWYFSITRLFGDVPYSEGGMGKTDGILYPKYDPQEDIIAGLLKELADANSALAQYENTKIDGDIIYGGDIKQWRKLINLYRLKILISCSMHETLKGERVAALFADIVNNPVQNPLMEKLSDSAIRDEAGNPGNYTYYNNNNFVSSYRISKYIVDFMKDRNDMRLPKYAEVMMKLEGTGADIRNLDNYKGVYPNPGFTSDNNNEGMDKGEQSRINKAWYLEMVGPSHMMTGYAEQEFILAEAVLRGWISGNIDTHYKNGIRAACEFRGVATADINNYLAHAKVQLTGTDSEKLGKIIAEKYLNFYMQAGMESYYEIRRTGYPNFSEYLTRNIDNVYNDGNLPLRYMYPQSEIDNNNEKVVEAINRLNRGDDRNSKMWLLQGNDPLFNPDPFPYRNY